MYAIDLIEYADLHHPGCNWNALFEYADLRNLDMLQIL